MKRVPPVAAVLACLGMWIATRDPSLAATATNAFRVTAIAIEGNNVRLAWQTVGTNSYYLLSSPSPTGTWDYVDFAFVSFPTATSTNFLDVGGATNGPARFYRVLKIVPG